VELSLFFLFICRIFPVLPVLPYYMVNKDEYNSKMHSLTLWYPVCLSVCLSSGVARIRR